MIRKLLIIFILASLIAGAAGWIIYNKLNVTQPDLICVISSEEAEKNEIYFRDEDDPSERVGVNEDGGIGYKQNVSVHQYVRKLGYSEEVARCSFALQGYSIVRFEPQQFHGVYLTLHVKKEAANKVFLYHYDPRYDSAWFLRSYRLCK